MIQHNSRTAIGMAALWLTFSIGQETAAQDKRRVLEEVIVTAQKQEQSLIDVPASVSVIDGKAMAENAALDAQDMVAYTPNVKYVTSNSVPTFTIRGFGTPSQGRHIEPSAELVDVRYSFGTEALALGL